MSTYQPNKGATLSLDQRENVRELKELIDKMIRSNDFNSIDLNGLRNVTRLELEKLKLFIEEYEKSGGVSFGIFRQPRPKMKSVLDAFGLKTR